MSTTGIILEAIIIVVIISVLIIAWYLWKLLKHGMELECLKNNENAKTAGRKQTTSSSTQQKKCTQYTKTTKNKK